MGGEQGPMSLKCGRCQWIFCNQTPRNARFPDNNAQLVHHYLWQDSQRYGNMEAVQTSRVPRCQAKRYFKEILKPWEAADEDRRAGWASALWEWRGVDLADKGSIPIDLVPEMEEFYNVRCRGSRTTAKGLTREAQKRRAERQARREAPGAHSQGQAAARSGVGRGGGGSSAGFQPACGGGSAGGSRGGGSGARSPQAGFPGNHLLQLQRPPSQVQQSQH
jgi:uncharacterized membrane protein YgcG